MSYSHRDQVKIKPVTHVWKIRDRTYGDMYDETKFNEDVTLEKVSEVTVMHGINEITGTVVRELSDGRYVVSVVVTEKGTGRFSDDNYVILEESKIERI